METKNIKVKIRFTESILGTLPQDEEIFHSYIGSKAPDATDLEDEVATLGVDEVAEKGITVFHKDEGIPFLYDYQIKGFMKGACSFLAKVPGSESSKLKAYKKAIDGLIFVYPKKVHFKNWGTITKCERPLRASTMQGDRVALASSEQIDAGAEMTFTISCLNPAHIKLVQEWFEYGQMSGIGQWRNSGHGRFELVSFEMEDGDVVDEVA